MIGKDPLIKKRVNHFSYIEKKVGLKANHCIAQNAALFVPLFFLYLAYIGITIS